MERDIVKLNEAALKGRGAQKEFKDKQVLISDLENSEESITVLKARLKAAADYREKFEEMWRRSYKAWMQVLDTKAEDSWESKRFLPVILQHVESALPAIVSAAIGGERIWAMTGATPQGRDSAKALEKLATWQSRGPSRVDEAVEEMLWWATTLGIGYVDLRWSLQYGNRLVPTVEQETDALGNKMFNEDGTPQNIKIVQEKEVKIEDYPVAESLNPLHVWMCPWSKPGDDAPWAFVLRETTWGALMDAAGKGHIFADGLQGYFDAEGGGSEHAKANTDINDSQNWDGLISPSDYEEWIEDAGYGDRDSLDLTDDTHWWDRPVKILVYRSKRETITIAPGFRIIGYTKNMMMHGKTGIISHAFIPIPNCPYGRGLGTILLGHQELLNENMNLFMDTAKISLMAPVVLSPAISPLDKNFRWQPNAIIRSRDVNNGMKRAEIPPPSNLAMLLDQHLKRDADDTTGFNEQARGFSSTGVNTATEFSGLQQNIKTRTFMHVRRLNRTLKRIGQMLVQLNQQFMTKEQIISVIGEDGLEYMTVQPWEIVGEVVVQATVSSSRAAPALRSQQLISLTQVIVPLIPMIGQNPFITQWIRLLLESIEVEDIDRMIPKSPGTPHSAQAENIALQRGVPVGVHPMDDDGQHIALHSEALMAMQGEYGDLLDPIIVDVFMKHNEKHMMAAQQKMMAQMQQQQAQMGGGGMAGTPGIAPQGGPGPGGGRGVPNNGRVEATAYGAAQGNQGIPGAASPGPGAPPGRPM